MLQQDQIAQETESEESEDEDEPLMQDDEEYDGQNEGSTIADDAEWTGFDEENDDEASSVHVAASPEKKTIDKTATAGGMNCSFPCLMRIKV